MSADAKDATAPGALFADKEKATDGGVETPVAEGDGGAPVEGLDVLSLQDLDPALNMKMHLVNNVGRLPPAAGLRPRADARAEPCRQSTR